MVGLACNEDVRTRYVDDVDLARLESVAEFSYHQFSVPSGDTPNVRGPTPRDSEAEAELAGFAAGLDALIVCHGSPFVGVGVLDAAAHLSLLGEVEGDRFGHRVDLPAAQGRGIVVVDTTHGSSLPTAEWALGLALIGLRNAGALFRRLIAHEAPYPREWGDRRYGAGYERSELTHRRIGMIGFGHIARILVGLLRPFDVEIVVYDPFVSRELAGAYDVAFGPIGAALAADVVFCLVPLTVATKGMLSTEEFEQLRPGSVFVNVSRGQVVDSPALLSRLARGDVIACLDVFDPEPIPLDSPVLDLPNVFLSPHIGGNNEEKGRRCFSLMVDECLRHFAGLEPRNELTTQVVQLRNKGTVEPNQGASR
jgi:phosphoglycerate dehydrogenase-like enzyme